jgi:hypothetical protein
MNLGCGDVHALKEITLDQESGTVIEYPGTPLSSWFASFCLSIIDLPDLFVLFNLGDQ